ncbi:MAG TPA: D-alanine--D-alanine ligase [Candidatus Eisenbacteria bacterium]|jgi:D-alanine-D-alanine ligase|nr:D-alanine--D-alanine ligase [Candidatus Eisenbacteria bacterium]
MKIVILMGGRSAERAVSLTTGAGMAAALRRLGHDVLSLDAADGRALPPGAETSAPQLEAASDLPETALVRVPSVTEAQAVVIALHGGAGENGTLQAVLDLARVPYTGSGMLASALAMDKALSKRLFEHAGIPTPPWLVLPSDGPPPDPADVGPIGGFPVVVKPNDQGSTVGLTIVEEPKQLVPAFELAAKHSRQVLIERFIPGRELTVAVIGHEALPIVEIIPNSGFYDYESKYTAGATRYECPAVLPADMTARVQELGLRAFETLGCRGVARVDFRLDPEGRPSCLEVNTVPGMTPTSLVPMAAKAAGLSYDDVVARMLALALEPEGGGQPAVSRAEPKR